MNLFQLVLKQMRQRALGTWLTLLSVTLGVALAVAVLLLRRGGDSLFGQTDYGYDLIIGKGSPLQLVLNTVYHIENSPGNIPYSLYERLATDRRQVKQAIPIAVGDTYKQRRIVGTVPQMFGFTTDGKPVEDAASAFNYRPGKRFEFADGTVFHPRKFEAVIGSDVPQLAGLKVGDTFHATHGAPTEGQAAHEHGETWRVVGVLKPTRTSNDRVIFVPLVTTFSIPEHSEGMAIQSKIRDAQSGVPAAQRPAATVPAPEPATESPAAPARDLLAGDAPATKPDAKTDEHDHNHEHQEEHEDKEGEKDAHAEEHEHAHDEAKEAHHDEHAHAEGDKGAHREEHASDQKHADHEAEHKHEGEAPATASTTASAKEAAHDDDHAGEHAHADEHAGHEEEHHEHTGGAGHAHEHEAYTVNADGTIEPKLPKDQWLLSAVLVKARAPFMAQTLEYSVNAGSVATAVKPAMVMSQFFDTVFAGSTLVLLLIAAMVSVVAAVGILVSIYNSVSARKREIAILRALGATKARVLALICIEAGLIGLVGGLAGWVLGHLAGAVGARFLERLLGQGFNWMAVGPEEVLYLAAVVAIAVLAGLVPAMKAYRTPVATNLVAS